MRATTRTASILLGTMVALYAGMAVIGGLDGLLFAHPGHGGHLAEIALNPPTAAITMHNLCMGGALFAGPNQTITVNGEGMDVDCANGVGGGPYNDTVTLTWLDSASGAMGLGGTFAFNTACPAMDTASTVTLSFQDDGVHAGGTGVQDLLLAMGHTLNYTILVPMGAMSGPAVPVACPAGTFGARATFTTTVDPRPECPVCWSGIFIGEPLNTNAAYVASFMSTCEFPNMASDITTGGAFAVMMNGNHTAIDNVGGCAAADVPYAMDCQITFTIPWEWDCAVDGMGLAAMPKPLQNFNYTQTGMAGNAMTGGGISSRVFTRTP